MQPLTRSLSIALLVGTVLLGVGAMFHPILPHDPSAQLRMIAATWYFRPIHLAMLAGTALIILGIWTRALIGPTSPPLLAALALVSLGLCFNAIDIAFMASAGIQLATVAQAGERGGGHAVRLAAPRRAHDGALRQRARGARRDRAELGGASGEHALAVAAGVDRGAGRAVLCDRLSGGEPVDPRGGDADAGVAGGDGCERAGGRGPGVRESGSPGADVRVRHG